MSYPVGWDLVNVTGTYIGKNGVPCVGSVTFSSPQLVLRSGTIVPAADIVFTLVNGAFSGQIPATDDPNANPVGWVYTVTENVPGGRQGYQIVAPHTSPGIDLSTVVPVTMPQPPTFGFPYVTLSQLAGTAVGDGAYLIGYQNPGSGSVARTVQAKLADIVSVNDFSTLNEAQIAAGVNDVVDTTTGKRWVLGITAPTFGEAAGVLGRNIAFDNLGNTISIPASKQWNFIGIRNGGNEVAFTLGASAIVGGVSYYLNSQSGSDATSNVYGVIGNISNYGAGTTKALYGRVTAKAGMTGIIIASVHRAEVDTSSMASSAVCAQMGHAGDSSISLYGIIQFDTEAASGKSQYGIVSLNTMAYTTAFIRACAGGGGKFLQWQASGGGSDLFNVLDNGCATFNPAASGTKMIDLQNGAQINFTSTSASATAGTAVLPANPTQFILVQVGGTTCKIPVYAA